MAIALAGLAALAAAMGIGRFAFTPLLPMMQADAGLTLAQGGWLASANYLGYFLGALSAHALGISSRAALRTSLLVITVATAAMGWWSSFAGWALLRLLAGVGSAWVVVHLSAWTFARFAALGRPALAGTVYAGVGTGIVVAGLVCLVLMAQGGGSRAGWLSLAGVSLAVTLVLWPVIGRAEAAPLERAMRTWQPGWRGLALAYGAFGFGYIVPATFLPALARALVDDPAVFGWAWPVFGGAAALSTLAAAPLIRRFGNRGLWLSAQLIMCLGVAAPVLVGGLAGILTSAVLVGATFVVITMAALGVAQAEAGSYAPRLMAVLTAAFAAGQVLGPLFIGMLDLLGGSLHAGLLAAAAALAAGSLPLLRTRGIL